MIVIKSMSLAGTLHSYDLCIKWLNALPTELQSKSQGGVPTISFPVIPSPSALQQVHMYILRPLSLPTRDTNFLYSCSLSLPILLPSKYQSSSTLLTCLVLHAGYPRRVPTNRPFPSSCLPPLQCESKCKVFEY